MRVTYIEYNESHRHIVRGGIDKIRAAFAAGDTGNILSLLLCLDFYLDPYYGHTLPYEKEIFDLLQETAVKSDNDEIIEDCLELISLYGCPPFKILEDNFDNIKESMKPYAKEIINCFM